MNSQNQEAFHFLFDLADRKASLGGFCVSLYELGGSGTGNETYFVTEIEGIFHDPFKVLDGNATLKKRLNPRSSLDRQREERDGPRGRVHGGGEG